MGYTSTCSVYTLTPRHRKRGRREIENLVSEKYMIELDNGGRGVILSRHIRSWTKKHDLFLVSDGVWRILHTTSTGDTKRNNA